MTSEPVVSAATAGDAAAIAEMQRRCFAEQWSDDDLAALLSGHGAFALLATRQGRHVGYALLRVIAGEGEIISMAVLAGERGRGVGGGLLAAGIAEARRKGAAKMLLEVAVDNLAARRLYAAAGFAEVGRRRAYYGPAGGDALLMAATLAEGGEG